jgi:hypothetical protein
MPGHTLEDNSLFVLRGAEYTRQSLIPQRDSHLGARHRDVHGRAHLADDGQRLVEGVVEETLEVGGVDRVRPTVGWAHIAHIAHTRAQRACTRAAAAQALVASHAVFHGPAGVRLGGQGGGAHR